MGQAEGGGRCGAPAGVGRGCPLPPAVRGLTDGAGALPALPGGDSGGEG